MYFFLIILFYFLFYLSKNCFKQRRTRPSTVCCLPIIPYFRTSVPLKTDEEVGYLTAAIRMCLTTVKLEVMPKSETFEQEGIDSRTRDTIMAIFFRKTCPFAPRF